MPMPLDVDCKLVVAHFFECTSCTAQSNSDSIGRWNQQNIHWANHRDMGKHWKIKSQPSKWWMLRPSISSQIGGCLKYKPRVGTNPMWVASWLMFCIIVQLGKVKQFGQVHLWKLPFQNAAFPKWYDFSLFQKQLCLLDPERPAHQNWSKMPSSKIGPSNSWSCGWVHLSVPEKQSD